MNPDITLVGAGLAANLDEQLATCRFQDSILGMEFSKIETDVALKLEVSFPILIPDTKPIVTDSVITCPAPQTGNFTG